MITTKPTNIDEYIACFPGDIQIILQGIRSTIKKAAPLTGSPIRNCWPELRGRRTPSARL